MDTDACWIRGQLGAVDLPSVVDGVVAAQSDLNLVPLSGAFDGWNFRRKTWGAAPCEGQRGLDVRDAYEWAYACCRAAELELEHLVSRPDVLDRRTLWSAEQHAGNRASWAYWFGEPDVPGWDFDERAVAAFTYVSNWSRAFRTGFYSTGLPLPVYIRCDSNGCVGDARARHFVPNTITLCGGTYFGMPPDDRAITMLHEMGHYSSGTPWTPRDERNTTYCHRGEDGRTCYRNRVRVGGVAPQHRDFHVFVGGDPRNLVLASQAFNPEVVVDVLNNVDNYVCLMWNRWVDRGTYRFAL